MNIYVLSFTTDYRDWPLPDLALRQIRLNHSARKFGLHNCISWNRQQLLKTDFYKKHKHILDQEKGAGFWLWKPYIILQELQKINTGDILIYCDTSMCFVDSPQILVRLCQQNGGFFLIEMDENLPISQFTKRDTFHFMHMDNEECHQATGTQAYIQIYEKNNKTLAFVEEMLHFCQHENIITDAPNISGNPNLPNFRDHKGDMPVLSLLRLKHSIEGFRNPSQWGNHSKLPEYRVDQEWLMKGHYLEQLFDNSPYGTIFHWDKECPNCKHPWAYYLNPHWVWAKVKRKTLK